MQRVLYPEFGGRKFARNVRACLPKGTNRNLSVLRSSTRLLVLDRRKQITVLAAMNRENGCRKFSLNAGNTAHMHVAVML